MASQRKTRAHLSAAGLGGWEALHSAEPRVPKEEAKSAQDRPLKTAQEAAPLRWERAGYVIRDTTAIPVGGGQALSMQA